ncbi:2757_t:CDS:2, partial [Gigaspora margarita]
IQTHLSLASSYPVLECYGTTKDPDSAALNDIYKEGLIHRDLHSGNIIYNEENNFWKVEDFGLCIPINNAEELYYGPFAHNWWVLRTYESLNNGLPSLYLIRIGMKTSTYINNIEFVIRVVQQIKNNKIIPGYICQTSGYICSQTGQDSGPVENDLSTAITNLYRTIFPNNFTRLLGPLMMGLDNNNILKEIISDLTF